MLVSSRLIYSPLIKGFTKTFQCLLVCLSFLAISFVPLSAGAEDQSFSIALMPTSGAQRTSYYNLLAEFKQQHKAVSVSKRAYEHENYKESIHELLTLGTEDVFFWFGGAKLTALADKGLIADISTVWKSKGWDKRFTRSAASAVEHQGKYFGIPINYYQWGIYYRQTILAEANVSKLSNWADLLLACRSLAQQNRHLFTVGTQSPWSIAAWFDYLNLRINGLDYHKSVMAGEQSFTSRRMFQVFKYWQQAIEADCFNEDRSQLDWKGALPLLYHGKSAAVLMGNFFVAGVPNVIQQDLKFVSFPEINPNVPIYEDAPVDVIMLSKDALDNPAAISFITYLVETDALLKVNDVIKKLSTFDQTYDIDDPFIKAGYKLLNQAKGVAQFYDRDTRSEMSVPAMDLMVMFINQQLTIDEVLVTLEHQRQAVYQ